MSVHEFPERDSLEVGQDAAADEDVADYYNAIFEATEAGEPWFSFDEFMNRRKTIRSPAPFVDDDNIPF
jgi:hypothetical protein